MRYQIVGGRCLEELEAEVNEFLALGWRCQGGPFTFSFSGECYQAMIKERS